jgi:hypothetical protein
MCCLFQMRKVHYGEELSMDYNSVTSSDVEWRSAICLCGMSACRGSFLHYATQDDLQQVLNKNCGPMTRYASLLRACSPKQPTAADTQTLERHGLLAASLGHSVPPFITKYVADCLRFIEFERKALPCKLMRPRNKHQLSLYTFGAADMEARYWNIKLVLTLKHFDPLVHADVLWNSVFRAWCAPLV